LPVVGVVLAVLAAVRLMLGTALGRV
ncbi:MAG: hypothetical protein QOE37_2123, partial [Microbacteriaceae bacterium]|nr:hypothetical protein [Microbacteriaceae bacterium]